MAASVLLISRGIIHPSLPLRRRVRALLNGTAAGSVETTRSLRRLSALGGARGGPRADGAPSAAGEAGSGGARGAQSPAAVVLLFHEKEPSPGAVEALEGYVRSGGGVLAVHGALASFKAHPRYAELIGTPFYGHGKPGPIEVYPVGGAPGADQGTGTASSGEAGGGTGQAAATGGADPEPLARITDELYWVDLPADAEVRYVGVETPARRRGSSNLAAPRRGGPLKTEAAGARGVSRDPADAGRARQPICWERRVGEGRVAVVTLGHYARTLADPFVRNLLREELERVAGVAGVAGAGGARSGDGGDG